MEIIDIFAPYLYSVQYDENDIDEYHRLFQEWNDKTFVSDFLEANEKLLNGSTWKDTPSPEAAALKISREAEELEEKFHELKNNANGNKKPDFDSHFDYLDGEYKFVYELCPMKSYGTETPSFLRIYAIKLDANCYLITGGGIKLNKKIQNSPGLKDHVIKNIDKVLMWMKQNGIMGSDDV